MTKKIFNPSDWLQPQTNISSPTCIVGASRSAPVHASQDGRAHAPIRDSRNGKRSSRSRTNHSKTGSQPNRHHHHLQPIGATLALPSPMPLAKMEERSSIASAAFTTATPPLTATPSSPTASNQPATVSRSKPFSIWPNKRALLRRLSQKDGLFFYFQNKRAVYSHIDVDKFYAIESNDLKTKVVLLL